jgi:hypothetical protein
MQHKGKAQCHQSNLSNSEAKTKKNHSPMKRFAIAMALALAGSALNAHAQSAGSATTPEKTPEEGGAGGGLGHGRGGQHQPASPEKIAEELMTKFDADTDGKLSQSELTQALAALEEHHPRPAGGHGRRGRGGARGLGSSSTQGNPDAFTSPDAQSSSSSAAEGNADTQSAQGGNQPHPPMDQVAARLIEKYASDKKGLTSSELANAIREHRANQGQSGSQ